MIGMLARIFTGPVVKALTDAYTARANAKNDEERIKADILIERLESVREIALADLGRKWSATAMGRWLIVVPFGLWWTAIFMVQIINPWFGTALVVIAVPPDIMDLAKILVPGIVLGDVVGSYVQRVRR